MYHLISKYFPKITFLMFVKILTPRFIAKLLYSLFEPIRDETIHPTYMHLKTTCSSINSTLSGTSQASLSWLSINTHSSKTMSRSSMKLELIADDAARKTSLKKRKKGLLKKVQELSILCDVDACAIIYGPGDRSPEVWPSPEEATRVLMRLRDMPEMEQKQKMMNQEEFLYQKMRKLVDQLHKQEFENRELEKKLKMYEALRTGNFNELDIEQAISLSMMIELKLKKIYENMDAIRKNEATAPQFDEAVQEGGSAAGLNAPRENNPTEKDKEILDRQKQMMDMMMPRPNETYQPSAGPANPWPASLFPFN